ncbi:hypothetical protein EHS39_23510 [Ensifer sp. MPMI2T]|nr:hypothetical protein EHS39_23510 [Ensifer sp. MPMI2T]
MVKSPGEKTAALGWKDLASALSQAASGTVDWGVLAQNVAGMLATPQLDWESLSRAKEHVHIGSPNSAGMLEAFVKVSADEAGRNASAKMLEACCTAGHEPERMLREVRKILLNYLAFDMFTYVECYPGPEKNVTLVRGRFVMDGDAEFRWPARWMEVPSVLMERAGEGNVSIPDLDDYYEKNPEAKSLRDNVVSLEYARRGVKSFVSAMRMDGGRVAASLTLGRRAGTGPGPFGDAEQKYLDSFHLELVLRLIGEAFERRAVSQAKAISALFTPRAAPQTLADECVRMLGEGFELEYVGLFRVNRTRGQFEIVAQYDPQKILNVSKGYTQELDKGMLGHVLRKNKVLYAPNVRTKPPPFGYRQLSQAAASAMCLPLRLRGEATAEIEWILNLESTQLDAFPPPEQDALKQLVDEIERSLQLWFEARLCAVLLDSVDQGVVLLGEGTRIERANKTARRLLGLGRDVPLPRPPRDKYADLEAFGADRASRATIAAGSAPASGAHLRLMGPDGVERRAMAGASYHDEAFHRRVWLLGDVENDAWVGSLKYMEVAVRTVMAQAHGNVLLASALLKQTLAGIDAGGPAYLLVDRALRSLTMANIPYERVAYVHDAVAEPRRRTGKLDLRAELLRFREALPENEAAAFHLVVPDAPLVVEGDSERLSFAFRSLLGYLLSINPPGNQLQAFLTTDGRAAEIEMVVECAIIDASGLAMRAAVRDRIAEAEDKAFSMAGHGLDAFRAIIEAHGGMVRLVTGSNGEWRVIVSQLELGREKQAPATNAE